MGSRNNFVRPGCTSYPTYLEPLVHICCICSLWRPATSLQMNCYLTNSYSYFVWMFSIDWYLNWPHSTFISWNMVHKRVLGGVHMGGNFFLIAMFKTKFCFLGKSHKQGAPHFYPHLTLFLTFYRLVFFGQISLFFKKIDAF